MNTLGRPLFEKLDNLEDMLPRRDYRYLIQLSRDLDLRLRYKIYYSLFTLLGWKIDREIRGMPCTPGACGRAAQN